MHMQFQSCTVVNKQSPSLIALIAGKHSLHRNPIPPLPIKTHPIAFKRTTVVKKFWFFYDRAQKVIVVANTQLVDESTDSAESSERSDCLEMGYLQY